ncbi:carbohydrate ABC transporter permease [Roseobacter sp. GAI101]|uniref:carbohydrate ABC transporter permease n=1 Tax=Roseobacter sp. (strain GAI101) TaxID=391589 RepID=UPI000187213C|nr:sugar ABC transporter permease [Roseobacter sp. GAI101]EEB83453.1 binding-protein-dependent transport systems inner membrane component [Roseobacter sp. GAI101]
MSKRSLPRLLQTPAVVLLLLWMLVPLSMTLYFSFIRYVLNSTRRPEWMTPSLSNWRGLGNYEYVLFKTKDFWFAIQNSLLIVGSILVLTVILGLAIAVLINRSFPGRGIVRVLLISPFFVMPAVNAVLWINMILDPVLGLNGLAVAGLNHIIDGLRAFPVIGNFFSMWPEIEPISFRATQTSAYAVIMMVVWQWTPFAVLIFMTSLQSEDESQKEAATLDGANAWSKFRNLTVPHLARPIAIVVMIQSIFHLSLYAEIEIVSRGNGNKNLPYLIGEFTSNNIGAASATGIFAVILANIVAIFLLRMVGKSLMD